MPLHDWSRVPAGLFHDFHQSWSIRIKDALNAGRLPPGLMALVEQKAGPKESDVLAIEARSRPHPDAGSGQGGLATMSPPQTRIVRRTAKEFYSDRANRIVVRRHLGRMVAVVEIISPGNKDSRFALRQLVEKTVDFLRAGVHVLVIDLLPPTARDPTGIHKLIWDEIEEEDFTLPPDQDRVLASYETGSDRAAFIELVGVGDPLPEMPLFLHSGEHVQVPLEATYQATWDALPGEFRRAVETGVLPESVDE
ncbi:MAG: DUF4058 family protein [Planctomycetaceae bacterium]|nr:DUF4058 family protein [Planctomycetaceae bacterium]